MPLAPTRLGVCSWSIRPTSPADLLQKVHACGLRSVQLHLDPIRTFAWRADETAALLKTARIRIPSGMMSTKGEDYSTLESIKATGGLRPAETWEENLRAAEANAIIAQRFGIPLITFHAGFLPHDQADPERAIMLDRLTKIAETFASRGVRTALETGQESAATLLDLLKAINRRLPDNAKVGANFDPANMILYGMGDPIEAAKMLAPHIMQVHIKDANPADSLGEWGVEMPPGRGSVRWESFFQTLDTAGYQGNYMIEREAGETRVEDVAAARAFVLSDSH